MSYKCPCGEYHSHKIIKAQDNRDLDLLVCLDKDCPCVRRFINGEWIL
ncbi:MAG: hypothetical protein V3V41_07970 [Candidatus Heimdallarchaeota archaeon]